MLLCQLCAASRLAIKLHAGEGCLKHCADGHAAHTQLLSLTEHGKSEACPCACVSSVQIWLCVLLGVLALVRLD